MENDKKSHSRLKRILWMVLRTYILLAVVLYFAQDYLLFYPSDKVLATPSNVSLEYEDVFLTPDKRSPEEKVHAWYVPVLNETSKGTVLFCHGNAGNISYLVDRIKDVNSFGYDCMVIDYRGFGKSGGEPSEQNMYEDVLSAWEYLTVVRKIPASKIIVHGRSLGGGAASWLASKVRPAALVLESTFSSALTLAQEKVFYLPIETLLNFKFDTMSRLNEINCPIFVVHSKDDELIPYKHGQDLYRAVKGEKKFLEISGSHNEGIIENQVLYNTALKEFYAESLAQSSD